MGRSLRTAVLVVFLGLIGCGGSPAPPLSFAFVNQTRHSASALWRIWKLAQASVARQVDLNPLQRSLYGVPARILPGDARARQARPYQLVVAAEPDVSSQLLWSTTGIERPDPTGLIACPQPCNVRYAAAYSRYQPARVHYAASWEFLGDNFPLILQYEFESQILYALGYDVQWR